MHHTHLSPATAFETRFTRRRWLQTATLASFGATMTWVGRGANAQDRAKKTLIARTETPFNAEPPLDALVANYLTPWELFFVRSHGAVPEVDAASHRVRVEGLVERPGDYSVSDLLAKFASAKTPATLTCAGNRRAEFAAAHHEKLPGVGWGAGAIGHAEWAGVRLSDLLQAAGLTADAKHVWFEGLDRITDPMRNQIDPFGGSIPLERVLTERAASPPVLLATHMNGAALTAEHGAPVRMIVPGYIGARSIKWLSKIVVSDQPSPNRFVARDYKVLRAGTPEEIQATLPTYETALNSVIATPADNSRVAGERVSLRGFALPSGQPGRTIHRVEVTTNAGKTWTAAKIVSPIHEGSWVLWSCDVSLAESGETAIAVRAVDNQGAEQPQTAPWNLKAYQYNAWHMVRVSRS